MMQVSDKGKQLIRNFEGLRLEPYTCPAGVLTIGYGHAISADTTTIPKRITVQEAEELLTKDLRRVEAAIHALVKVPLTQEQFDALASCIFNIGTTAFARSTLLKKLNRGDYRGASQEMLRWVYGSDHEVLEGLLRRRMAETKLFTSNMPPEGTHNGTN